MRKATFMHSNDSTVIENLSGFWKCFNGHLLAAKANQALYAEQERSYQNRVAALKAAYDEKMRLLMAAADRVGLLQAFSAEMQQIEPADYVQNCFCKQRKW